MHIILRDSELAHRYLDDLVGIEIGAAAHNPFNLPNCINVDYTDDMETEFKNAEFELCGFKAKVDVIADGADLPFKDEEYDYVISSHVIEHFFDPIKAIEEWFRVIKKGGYIFIIAPDHYSMPGETRPCTNYKELIDRHKGDIKPEDVNMGDLVHPVTGKTLEGHGHWSVWDLKDFIELCDYMKWFVIKKLEHDDKVGNGFCVILKKN
jgi:SAM-dependent methyltransferase